MTRRAPYVTASDEELIVWSSQGDRSAFDEIVTRYGPFALRVALRLLTDREGAEDAAQEGLVRAWEQAARFDPERASFSTWLYRIVVNLCIDQRRKVRFAQLPDDFDAVDPAAAADEMLAGLQRRTALTSALRDLPARQRAALTLVYDEGLSGGEAAKILGSTAKAVERLLARARTTLRQRLSKDGLGKES